MSKIIVVRQDYILNFLNSFKLVLIIFVLNVIEILYE